MPWEGYSGAQILTAIDQQHKKLDWPQACPADFYKIMCECWSHQPEARPTFEDLIQKLAQIMPQQLITITSSTSDHPQLLQFTKGDVIVLINKLPTTCTPLPHTTQTQDEKMWFGALRRTGKLGYSSRKILSKQSNGDKAPAAASKKTVSKAANLLGGESDKERKKLLISQPHADLRHTCHIGADGRNFGLLHVNKTEFTRALLTTPNPSNSNTLSINTRPPSVCTLSHTSLSSSTAVSPHPQDPSAPTLPPKRSSFGVLPQQPLTIINHQQVMNKQSLQITALEHIHHQTLPPPRPPKTKAYRKDSNQMTSPFPSRLQRKVMHQTNETKESEDSEINGASTLEFANLQRPNSICATSVSCDADTSQEVTFPYSTGDSVFSSASLASSQALDQVLNDLQKDISDFSLSTINDFADTRPLLNQKHHPNQQPRAADGSSDQASQQQQSVVRAMTPEESDKWMKRVEEEHKKAAKTLKRLAKKESGSVEEEFTTVDNTTTDGPSTIVDCGNSHLNYLAVTRNGLPTLWQPTNCWSNAGSFLKNTPNNTLINSTNTSNGRKTDPQQHTRTDPRHSAKHHIEYINSN
uniref:CRIB domain-containing protein n=1 Tax=Ditylenchus dipsaci TaxID=166011 RepID=A0A915EG44_9BILA